MKAPFKKKPQEEWDDPYPKKKPMQWFTVVLLVLLVYVLSIGPNCLLYKKGIISESVWKNLYMPLWILAHKIPPMEKGIDWYIGVWGK